ncbi:hypothetical protein SAMN04487910_0719 [Aquimarina amphilecti]|uniref:Lipocalin-like domain-containing protein n=1 Tax=Aquimarina amphilecti TaxID=1038014 RepID=A0A1H7HP56_AQUAM|nr:hypothetical protein [Aquimarina amphilecti]SEK52146.1 hypothetical protein SAMN04487910_0719 [Aquimarina amphilecti]
MKLFFLIILSIFSTSSINNSNTSSEINNFDLEGVWDLKHQFLYDDHNEVSDTILNPNGYRQVKMYSKGKVMWTRFDPADSNEWFGYGTYSIKGNILEERLEYASGPMMEIVDTTQVFKFELILDKKSYQQITIDENGHYSQSENYTKVE